MLYEMLTGHRPHVFKNRSPHELSRVVCEVEPEAPSRAVSRSEARTLIPAAAGAETTLDLICRTRRASVEELQRELAGNLDRITLRALRKSVEERYANVEEMNSDIERHLKGQPVSAQIRIDTASLKDRSLRRRARHTGDTSEERALAVLPFRLLNPAQTSDTGDDYLGLGLADALITRLGSLRRFVVRPTSSVLRFQHGAACDPLEAGRELASSFVLEGRIQRFNSLLRVTAQLLDVRTGATSWAQVFDERADDMLALQDNLTTRVAEALVPHLSGDERERLAKRGTDDPEAFESYLRGRYHWSQFTGEGFAKAITCYYKAIAFDPEYALAYTGIADYYNWLGVYGVLPSGESFAAAREAAEQAIQIDDQLAEAHTALGFSLIGCGYRWEEAERAHLRALELDEACAPAHAWYSLQLGMEARFDEAIRHARRSIELDPLTGFNRYNLGWLLYHARRFDESIDVQQRLIEDEPNYGIAHFGLGWALAQVGRHAEALRSLKRARDVMPGITFVTAGIAAVSAAAGDEAEARLILAELHEAAQHRFVTPYQLAFIHVALDEPEAALRCLKETYAAGDAWLAWLGVEPRFDSLRRDPRCAELLRLTNNPSRTRMTAGVATTPHAVTASAPKRDDAQSRAAPPTEIAPPTANNEAHQLYVAGRYHAARRNADSMRQAIANLERAVELDSTFALAYAELAGCYALLNWYVEPPPSDAFERARASARRAIEIDDRLADAHASLGLIKLHYERDPVGAEREFLRAIELKPDNPVAHRWYAFSLSAAGRHDEAIREVERARRITPLSPVIATAHANVLFFARRFDECIAQCRKALDLDAGSIAAHVVLRWVYEKKGMCDEALATFEQERIFAGDTPTTHAKHAHVLAACGRHEESRGTLRELLANREEGQVTSYEIAVIYSLLDDREAAFEWLARAERGNAVGLTFAAVDPHLDNLRADPRFVKLVRRLKLAAHNTDDRQATRTNRSDERSEPTKSIRTAHPTLPPQSRRNESALVSNVTPLRSVKRRVPLFIAAASALAIAAASSLFLYTPIARQPAAEFHTAPPAKLTTTGNAVAAALAPDGNYVAYVIEEAGRQSLWMRQTKIANSRRIVDPAAVEYRGLTFSPDGAHIFYVAADKSGAGESALYKVPALGGSALRLRGHVDSPVAVAPDGRRFAFVRRDAALGRDALIVAGEGVIGDEREIAARNFPAHISIAYAPAWSPDNAAVAFATEAADAHGSYMRAVQVLTADDVEKELSARRWLTIGQMAWLPGGDALVVAAQEENSSFTQLWQLVPGGSEPRKLTDDLADYRGVSLTADGSHLVGVRREMLTSVWVASGSDPNRSRQITTGAGRYFDCSWTPDGKIIYASDAAGSADIWEMNPDGTEQRQLTAGAKRNYAPVASPDNRHIVFHSDRTGEWQLWRIRRDGGEPVQITPDGGDSNWAQVSPDNRTVVYEHTGENAPVTLWSVPLEGGASAPLTRDMGLRPAISPDGKSVAYWHKDATPNSGWYIAIKSIDANAAARLLAIEQGVANGVTQLRWTPDGGAIMYLDYRDGTTTLWRQPLDTQARTKLLESPGNVLVHSFDTDARGRLVLSRGLMVNDVVIMELARMS